MLFRKPPHVPPQSRDRQGDPGQRPAPLRGDARGPAVVVPDAGHGAVEFTPEGVFADRGRGWRSDMPVLQRPLRTQGLSALADDADLHVSRVRTAPRSEVVPLTVVQLAPALTTGGVER